MMILFEMFIRKRQTETRHRALREIIPVRRTSPLLTSFYKVASMTIPHVDIGRRANGRYPTTTATV